MTRVLESVLVLFCSIFLAAEEGCWRIKSEYRTYERFGLSLASRSDWVMMFFC
jgi:hypothetical protein